MAGKGRKKKAPKKSAAPIEPYANIEKSAARIRLTAAKLKKDPNLEAAKKDLPDHLEKLQLQIGALAKKDKDDDKGSSNTTEKIDLNDFFSGVATSLISAQNQLDQQSADYLASVSGKEHILPSVFRIPKLSAEIKFAVEKATSTGVNLFFFKDVTTEQVSNQQSVQFDIVSAPPPPDLPRSPVMASVILGSSVRQSILAKISQPPWTAATANAVLIYQIRNGEFILAFADPANLGVWYANTNAGGLAAAIRTFTSVGADLAPLRATVQALGLLQAKFLGGG
jgi:hypothetical protein